MSENAQHPLFVATRKLVGALDRLERNLQQMSVAKDRDALQQQQLMLFSRENEALKQEREHLNQSIMSLTSQYEDLQQVATSIHSKLDDSVKRINQIIES